VPSSSLSVHFRFLLGCPVVGEWIGVVCLLRSPDPASASAIDSMFRTDLGISQSLFSTNTPTVAKMRKRQWLGEA
jgi:hypothetical protein